MHIVEVYIESGGFDHRLIKGGISVYLWNLTRAFNARGHRTSVLSALNGQESYLTAEHGLELLDYQHDWDCSICADPGIWGDRVSKPIPLRTRAYRLRKDGTDFYYLGNDFLNLYPDTYYPPYEGKGTDIGFFKPLIFQMEAVRFIRHQFGSEPLVIHAHEPFYQYLLPAAFADDPAKVVVSTVQSNMPITKKVYVPETREALRQIGADPDVAIAAEPLADTLFNRCLTSYLPRTHLSYTYPAEYLDLFDLVLAYSDHVDFLSEGHLEFYTGFHGTAFRALFVQLPIARLYRDHADKLFVGGCGLGQRWLEGPAAPDGRAALLHDLKLDPDLPTFFHSARYAPGHKGQAELFGAIRQFLEQGGRANFVLRCITEAAIADPRYAGLARDFPDMVYFTTRMQSEDELRAMAEAADFALFPSKLEMDTFLIAQGEAMACGCVPIASDQLGMKHWRHGRGALGEGERTGFAVIRSFLHEDPALVSSIVDAIRTATALFREDPAGYAELSRRSRLCAASFGWQTAGDLHLTAWDRGQPAAAVTPARSKPGEQSGWLAAAFEAGQIVDLRHGGEASDLPEIDLSDGVLTYRISASSVLAFCWNGQAFDERSLEPMVKGGGFQGRGFADRNIYLLVTMDSGDQFWDGLIPAAAPAA